MNGKIKMFKLQSMENLSTLRLKGQCYYYEALSIDGLKEIKKYCENKNITFKLIGRGSNLILSEKKYYVKLNFSTPTIIDFSQESCYFPANYSISKMVSLASKNNIRGWEVITGIPGNLGGSIFMNAGTSKGEISSILKDVHVLKKNGEDIIISLNSKMFSYRKNHFISDGDIILGANVYINNIDSNVRTDIKEYLDYRKKTQPLKSYNCGCVFANGGKYLKAGRAIDLLGLKGFEYNGFKISYKHANFIENQGQGHSDDLIKLVQIQKRLLSLCYGHKFELEVQIV